MDLLPIVGFLKAMAEDLREEAGAVAERESVRAARMRRIADDMDELSGELLARAGAT